MIATAETGQASRSVDLAVSLREVSLEGTFTVPHNATGVVLFAHGSGSSRFSPRNRAVAATLNDAGLATLLLDLLTEEESEIDAITRGLRFNVELLAARLTGAVDWLGVRREVATLPVGLFGASTGAAAALATAAARPKRIAAVVSRGGRPDLAAEALSRVEAPTLLIVGGHDEAVVELNREAAARLRCVHRLHIVAGATHLFEEPGKLERVAQLARDWFVEHLGHP
jgi:pimeloyl-ACP methyl ester carboxylesterase